MINKKTIGSELIQPDSVSTTDVELVKEKLRTELTESIHNIDIKLNVLENIVSERNRNFKFTVNTIIFIVSIFVTIAINILSYFFRK